MNAVLLTVPLVVFALVVLFGFAGCGLPTTGTGPPPQGDPPWQGDPDPPKGFNEFIFASGPVAHWPLTDAADAPLAMDKVGSSDVSPFGSHPGTYVGSVARGPVSLDDSSPGNFPTLYDGTGSIEVPHDDPADLTFATVEFSVEALVLPDAVAPPTDHNEPPLPDAYIVRNVSAAGGWALQVVPGGHGTVGWFVARVWDSAGVPSSVQLAYDLNAPLGTAWFVLMRFQAGTLWLRVNTDLNGAAASYEPNTATAPLQIGVGFHGALQDVAVYDRVMGEQEAIDHMQASKQP